MKKNVLDIAYLQDVSPFFKSKAGIYVGNKLIKWLNIDKVNTVHARSSHLRGAAFTTALLEDPLIDVSYELHNESILDSLPDGPFITVSNHPIGSLDGIMLIDIIASRRPDFRVMANGILTNISAMKDNFISVKPNTGNNGANLKNVNGVRDTLAHIHDGHPVGFFPAGAISFYSNGCRNVRDLPWTHSVIRIIRKVKVPVFPIFFDFHNSAFFYMLGKISWRIRTLRIPAEVFNKRGQKANVYVGTPIRPEEIQAIEDDTALARFLYDRTYSAKQTNSK
jgi:putative hemolysin